MNIGRSLLVRLWLPFTPLSIYPISVETMTNISIFWFRRDLRIDDNAGLYYALKKGAPVLPIFIFDHNILDDLSDPHDARVAYIHAEIHSLRQQLQAAGGDLLVYYGQPEKVWRKILDQYPVQSVHTNRDYEPYALERDEEVSSLLNKHQISFHTYKDHVVFEKLEIQKEAGGPYTVFTPYSRKWKAKLGSKQASFLDKSGNQQEVSYYLKPYPSRQYLASLMSGITTSNIPSLEEMGFSPAKIEIPAKEVSRGLIRNYDQTRDFPAINGTSRLGIHFRFGTISIREKARHALQLNETYLNELIWRDFYAQILANFPHVADRSFRAEYEFIQWRNDEAEFKVWCEGKTGYPIVDAGMRELNATGYMHNRVRMIAASFLTKHLLIDWRWGEAYFAIKLLDFDLASNNGGWQWAAGCGTDAAPYFRIFNPESQQKKFDEDFTYIKRWVPEYGTDAYGPPIVDHKMARERCLRVYKEGIAAGRATVR